MCVVYHGYGGIGGVMFEVVGGMHTEQAWGLVTCREMLEHFPSER